MIAKVSVGSIVRSVRRVISLQSLQSEGGSRSGASNTRSYIRNNYLPESQDIELVKPEDTGEFTTMVERRRSVGNGADGSRDADLESSIYVEKSLRVESKERASV